MQKYRYDDNPIVPGDIIQRTSSSSDNITLGKLYVVNDDYSITMDNGKKSSSYGFKVLPRYFRKLSTVSHEHIVRGSTVVMVNPPSNVKHTSGEVFHVTGFSGSLSTKITTSPPIPGYSEFFKGRFVIVYKRDDVPEDIEEGDIVEYVGKNHPNSDILSADRFTAYKVDKASIYYKDGFAKDRSDVKLIRKKYGEMVKMGEQARENLIGNLKYGNISVANKIRILLKLRDEGWVSLGVLQDLCFQYIPGRYVNDDGLVCRYSSTTVEQAGNLPETKENNMLSNNVNRQLEENKSAAILAAEITAGKVLNDKVVSLVKPKLPMMLRGYADSGLAPVVIANVVGMAIKQYAPQNAKAKQVGDLMLQASALQAMEAFDIEGMLNDLIKDIKLPEITETTASA